MNKAALSAPVMASACAITSPVKAGLDVSEPPTAQRFAAFTQRFAAFVPVLLLLTTGWGAAIWHLGSEWTLNAQYNYGWAVPLLALYLVMARIESCPPPGRLLPRGWTGSGLVGLSLIIGIALLFREVNPEWRLVGGVLSGAAIGITLLLLGSFGGFAWVSHFAFPVLFFLTAVPWPRPQEAALMASLMHVNAGIAAEALRWLGHEAATRGNLIQLAAGVVGVEEACSGVRSLQGSIMISLFLGQLLALPVLRRAFLFATALGLALLGNAVRTTWLGLVAARDGLAAVEHWHDTAGFTILGSTFFGLLAIASLLRRRKETATPAALGGALLSQAAVSPQSAPSSLLPTFRANVPWALAASAVIVASFLSTQGWFLWHERALNRTLAWRVELPRAASGFHEVPMADRIRADLRFDEGESATWTDPAGLHWRSFQFRWKPGRIWEQSVLIHDPRVCLQASGLTLVSTLPALAVERDGFRLDFEQYEFSDGRQPVFVFNCVTSDVLRPVLSRSPMRSDLTRDHRLQAVLRGERHLGQRRFEVALNGASSAQAAATAFRSFVEQSLRTGSN